MSLGTTLEDAYAGDKGLNASFLQDNEEHTVFDQGIESKNTPFVDTLNVFPRQIQDANPQHLNAPSQQYIERVDHPPMLAPIADNKLQASNPVQDQTPTTAYQYNYDSVREQMQNEAMHHKLQEIQLANDIQQSPKTRRKRVEHFNDGEIKSKNGKSDLYKSIVFTLLILLAISTHFFIDFLYQQFLTASGEFSLKQEAGFRLLYPVVILAFIWYAKS